MRLILIRHAEPDYVRDSLTEKGWREAELLSTRDLDPARRERDREDHDERGAMIRAMARARAGDVLLWLLLFGAAYLYFFGVPKWVNITLLGLACVKLLLDWMFTVWYRRQY